MKKIKLENMSEIQKTKKALEIVENFDFNKDVMNGLLFAVITAIAMTAYIVIDLNDYIFIILEILSAIAFCCVMAFVFSKYSDYLNAYEFLKNVYSNNDSNEIGDVIARAKESILNHNE